MKTQEIVISDFPKGHYYFVAELIQLSCRFESEIILENESCRSNAKSIMGMMGFYPVPGMRMKVTAEGNDEQEAVSAIAELLTHI